MLALVDCNNFYASCERVFRPDLEGQPVGILSNNDGCVIARSNEIKPLVAMGMPLYQIPPDIRRRVTLLSSNYALYGDARAVLVFLKINRHRPDLPQYSPSVVELPDPTDDTRLIVQTAHRKARKKNAKARP